MNKNIPILHPEGFNNKPQSHCIECGAIRQYVRSSEGCWCKCHINEDIDKK